MSFENVIRFEIYLSLELSMSLKKSWVWNEIYESDLIVCFLFAEGLGCSELGSMEADPDDCGSFLICNHNEYQKMACRDGTHYDPQVKVCNHPDQVKCEVGGNSVKPIRIRLEK